MPAWRLAWVPRALSRRFRLGGLLLATVVGFGVLGQLAGRTALTSPSRAPVYVRHLVVEDPYATIGLGGSWYRGALHVATVRAQGKELPRVVGDYFKARGYDFLAVTDANTYTWVGEYANGPLVGIASIQASYRFGNLLALNMDHWMPAGDLQAAIDWIQGAGGLAVLAAPNSLEQPMGRNVLAVRNLFGLEVYDARLAALDPAQGDATRLWDQLLSGGKHVFAFAGEDVLSISDPAAGSAWISVLARTGDAGELLSSLRAGAFYASSGAGFTSFSLEGRTIVVTAPAPESLRFIGSGGRLLSAVAGEAASYTVKGDEGYVRVEAIADDGARAWSQPFFLSWQ